MKEPPHPEQLTGDALLSVLAALANPHRLRMMAALAAGRNYVSQLAREMGISRPLLHMHLRKLESAGLIRGSLTLSEDGKAMRFYDVVPFALHLTPEAIAEAVRTLTDDKAGVLGRSPAGDKDNEQEEE